MATANRLIIPPRPIAKNAWKEEIERWLGSPFQKGGLTGNGIDGAGLVFQTYRSVAGLTMPMTVQRQFQQGADVSVDEL